MEKFTMAVENYNIKYNTRHLFLYTDSQICPSVYTCMEQQHCIKVFAAHCKSLPCVKSAEAGNKPWL